jgi:hypothetical protein
VIKKTRQKLIGSLKKMMPTKTVPTAPIPVQTAYAVPKGKLTVALFKNTKLIVAQIKNPNPHFKLEKLLDNFKHVVNPISKQPAIIR